MTLESAIDSGPVRLIRSALYIDFDNVYSGLRTVDRDAAQAFASNPAMLLDWLRTGRDDDGPFVRRFLVRDCYLNPKEYAWCRAEFVAAGFRVIDCPSLTQQGKSSADTHIVLDAVDALGHATRYDEFVICSADADFSPLMTKLRRHDRRTVMIAAGPFAPAYEAVCDTTIGPMQLVEAFTGDPPVGRPERAMVSGNDLAKAAAAVRQTVQQKPIPGAVAASVAQRAAPGIAADGWASSDGFASFVRSHLPDLRFVESESETWLLDPARSSATDIPSRAVLPDVVARVCRVTRAPRLSSQEFSALFNELAQVGTLQPALGRIGADVRDRVASRADAVVISRTAANFVVQGLMYSGADPRSGTLSPRQLAERWRGSVAKLCRQAGMQLGDEDEAALDEWILSEIPPD